MTKNKKIVYVLSSARALGGASKSFLMMLEGVARLGVEPIVVVPDDGPICKPLQEMNIGYIVVHYRFATYPEKRTLKDLLLFLPRFLVRQVMNIWAVYSLFRQLKGTGIALVHTNVSVVDIGFRLSRKLGVPHVYHIREYADIDFDLHYYPSKQHFRRALVANDSYSICITRDIQQYHGQADNPNSRVIYNGICSEVSEFPHHETGDYMLYAGRVEYTKGLDLLLKAYVLCKERGDYLLPLYVAGRIADAQYMHDIESYIHQNKLSDSIVFLGERTDMDSLLSQTHFLVVTSRSEAFGRCMPEAMFHGCLVIANDTAGTKEQLDNGLRMTGEEIALRFHSVIELADCLHEVDVKPLSYFTPMRQRAFDVVNSIYTAEENARQVYRFYLDILGRI